MSTGPFVSTFYETDDGDILLARVQPETITSFNPGATGPATVEARAYMSGSRRRNGVQARYVSGRWVGDPPDDRDPCSIVRLPVFTPTAFSAIARGSTVAYNGGNIRIIGKTNERLN